MSSVLDTGAPHDLHDNAVLRYVPTRSSTVCWCLSDLLHLGESLSATRSCNWKSVIPLLFLSTVIRIMIHLIWIPLLLRGDAKVNLNAVVKAQRRAAILLTQNTFQGELSPLLSLYQYHCVTLAASPFFPGLPLHPLHPITPLSLPLPPSSSLFSAKPDPLPLPT